MFNDERDARKIQHLEGRKQVYRQKIDTIQTFDRSVGYLWAASGFRVHPQNHFGLDWALVKLPEHRPTPNLVSLLFTSCNIYVRSFYEANRPSLICVIAPYS
jgi:hypothetical protein